MPANGHLLANGFHAGRTWLFDLARPLSRASSRRSATWPGSAIRTPSSGSPTGTCWRRSSTARRPGAQQHAGRATSRARASRGTAAHRRSRGDGRTRAAVIRSAQRERSRRSTTGGSIRTACCRCRRSIARCPRPPTWTRANKKATSEWVQFWRLSDLTLLRSIALAPGPRGDENQFTGEPRLLPDGQEHLHPHVQLRPVSAARRGPPRADAPRSCGAFEGKDCGVPVLTGHYWLQTGARGARAGRARHQRSRASARGLDARRRRGRGSRTGSRSTRRAGGWCSTRAAAARATGCSSIDFDPGTGRLRDRRAVPRSGQPRPGIRLTDRTWPHGFAGTAVPHGTVFSR